MYYKVLALKYRPTNFDEFIGQKNIIKALKNTLKKKKLHHAYLFSGTRGVGKTSISRVLVKSLNCLKININFNPCNLCKNCKSIDLNNFIDYIELDAASHRGVEEINYLLKQSLYSPLISKYKIYMIDEVHMLTNYAFSAMLKILEEPPKYVKFILVTTEKKKIPVTILSRCIHFNLKKISYINISKKIFKILKNEEIKFEKKAVNLISLNANGSMRDALSLLDQALLYCKNNLKLSIIKKMLGIIDNNYLFKILKALLFKDGRKIYKIVNKISKLNISYQLVLKELSLLFFKILLFKLVPISNKINNKKKFIYLSSKFSLQKLQLYYKISLYGKKEICLAPDEYSGFIMIMFRMITFKKKLKI